MTLSRNHIQAVPCPECGAKPGDWCVYVERPKRYKAGQSHFSRMQAAQALNAPARVEHAKPTITLVADASWKDTDKRAGWAGFIKADNRPDLQRSGPAVYHKNGSLIELEAIGQTLRAAHDIGLFLPEDTHMVIQSDSLGALSALATLANTYHGTKGSDVRINPIMDLRDPYLPYVRRIGELIQTLAVVYLKHVRGHQNGKKGRYAMNAWCDRAAKKAAWGEDA